MDLVSLLGGNVALYDLVLARLRERISDASRRALDPVVRRLLAHPDRRVRRSAISAAEDFGVATDALVPLVGDAEASVRHAAVGACGRLRLMSLAGAMEARLDDDDPEVRATAASALARLRPESRAAIAEAAAAEECPWVRARMERSVNEIATRNR